MNSEPELEGLRAAAQAMLEAENDYRVAGFTRSKTLQDEALSNLTKAHIEHVPKFSTPVLLSLLDSLQSTRAALERAEGERDVLHRELAMAWNHAADWALIANKRPGPKDRTAEQWLAMKAREAKEKLHD